MIRTLVVDDEADIRALLSAVIKAANEGLHVAALASSGEEALALLNEVEAEVIVLDQRMPGLTGLETAARILAAKPSQSIVLFTAFLDPEIERQADELGVCACLSKSMLTRLPDTLRRCAPAA
jgi:YesN/AraC family two-component response regulator